jgi:hypothetical protein
MSDDSEAERLAGIRWSAWDAWYEDGARACDNPYPVNTPEHDAWRDGFLDARIHYE